MLQYGQNALSVPWEEEHGNGEAISVEEWLAKSEKHASKNLHHSPWRVRVNRHGSEIYLDLAIFHALFDARSLQLIFDDVAEAYNDGSGSVLVPLEPVIKEIINASQEKETNATFWRQLGSKATPTRFPNLAPLRYDTAPPVVITKDCTRVLPELEAGCRKANTTLQSVGIASWLTILSAYTGEPSVTCGVVLSGRSFEAATAVVFPCITTIPFACTVADDKESILKDIMVLNTDIQDHQFTPLTTIQKLAGYPNEPLFDTIFAFQKTSDEESRPQLWTVVDEKATVEYPVSIELEPKDGRLSYRLTFLPHILPKEQACLILEQLDYLINSFVFPETSTTITTEFDPALYSITPAKEPTLHSEATLLHEFVEISARDYPDRIALEFASSITNGRVSSKSWSYKELDICGNKAANMLVSHGVRPGDLVAVCFDKCPEASFAMLGILKAGAAFVALDPSAPSARRGFIIEDSGASIVLLMKAQSADLPESDSWEILNLDEESWESLSPRKPVLSRPIDPQDRSYCLYTSGTTGTPKGCEITHENVIQFILYFQRLFAGNWDEESRWLQFASFHFDVSVLEQYWGWSTGIRVVSAPRDVIFEDLAAAINTLGITHIDLTPSLARTLHPDDVPSLRLFITGGESLKQEILDVWGPKRVIYNGYGPTEATIGCTMYPRVPAHGKPSNIGPQFDNVGSYVLKPGTDVPVLRGAVGELCVSGKLVGKGYLNRPELTKERFAYLDRFNDRVYRTGDLVRILHDGTFDFLGRADDQVKLRGQRLEIGEINSVVRQSGPGISDVATLVLKHPKQQKDQLVCFVVVHAQKNGHPSVILEKTSELETAKEACQEKLPGYMVPTHFVALAAMPLSANNKAEGRKLKEMYEALSVNDLQSLSGFGNVKEQSWSESEEKIRTVLCDFLQIDREDISKSTSFFELGLDSISVVGLSRELKHAGFSKAAVSIIMKNASIARLSKALIDKTTPDDRGSILAARQAITAVQHRYRRIVAEALSVDSRDIEVLAPCTPLQQGMIARSMESDQGLYFNAFYLNLAENTDVKRLRDAWETAFAAIQILRTVFVSTDDGFLQAVRRRSSLQWSEHDLRDTKSLDSHLATIKRSWQQANKEVIKMPFELHLVNIPHGGMLVVHIFHALYDGISIQSVFRNVWEIYGGQWNQDVGPSFHSVLAYGPLRSMSGAREFWQRQLSRQNFRPFPTLADTPSEESVVASRDISNLSPHESVRRKLNVTAQAISQACWATILNTYIKGVETLGIIASGRNIDFESADEVIGPLFNTIPYQHNVPLHTEAWSSIIKRTHEYNVTAHPYQHSPLRDIMKWTKRNADQPLFDTLFVYQVAGDDEQKWHQNEAWALEDGGAYADYPLALEVEQRGTETLTLTLVAQGTILDQAAANRLLIQFEECMQAILDNPDALVKDRLSGLEDLNQDVTVETKSAATNLDGTNDFKWTSTARALKEEIVALTGADDDEVNERTSIFELGLDSIDAIKLSSKLKKRDIHLPVSAIMRALSIANMSEQNTQLRQRTPESRTIGYGFQIHDKEAGKLFATLWF